MPCKEPEWERAGEVEWKEDEDYGQVRRVELTSHGAGDLMRAARGEIALEGVDFHDALIDGVLLEGGGRMMIVGPSKIGKTQEALYLSLMLATGGEWRGHRCKQSRVFYASVELDYAEVSKRVNAIGSWLDLDPDVLNEHFRFTSLVGVHEGLYRRYDRYILEKPKEYRPGTAPFYDRRYDGWEWEIDESLGFPSLDVFVSALMSEKVGGKRPNVYVVDPLQKLLAGVDETSAGEINTALLRFDDLRPATVILVHHPPKGNGDSQNVYDSGRGSSALGADAAAVVQLVRLRVRPGTPEHDEMVRAGVSDPTECAEMRFGFRSFPSVPPLRLMATRPIALPMESDSPLQGSHTLAARGGEARAARAAEDRERRARAVAAAVAACEADGVRPTGRNVLERIAGPCEAEGIDPPTSERSARRWVKECQDPSL